MADPIKVDSHIHVYRNVEEGEAEKDGYQVWEYGPQEDTHISALSGTLDELLAAMAAADIRRGIAVNLYIADEQRAKLRAALPPHLAGAALEKAEAEIEAKVLEDLKAFNRWGCRVARDHPEIATFVGADVTLLSGEAAAAHLRDMAENEGAAGLKLHGAACGFYMGDERLWPTYAACRDMGLPVIGHAGPDKGGKGFAEPRAFGEVLRAFPDLPIVLAHMGGATWRQTLEIAEGYPNAYFDCCEIIEWTHSEKGPDDEALARLIQDVGPERVMMGSDYPWYDLDHTVERVLALPLLSAEEKEGILGANAVRILRL